MHALLPLMKLSELVSPSCPAMPLTLQQDKQYPIRVRVCFKRERIDSASLGRAMYAGSIKGAASTPADISNDSYMCRTQQGILINPAAQTADHS
jgi:hypothetical protein